MSKINREIDLNTVKGYLRIEVDFVDEDPLLIALAKSAEEYIYNATNKRPNYDIELYKLAVLMYVCQQYEDRSAIKEGSKNGTKYGLENVLLQLELMEDWENE